jgi:3-oxoadipate enol-lactonase
MHILKLIYMRPNRLTLRRAVHTIAIVLTVDACATRQPAESGIRTSTPHVAWQVDSASIAVNGTRLFYETAGMGSTVVLLHGGNLDRRMWDDQFLSFAQSHRVLRYDARGFGRSGRADAPYEAQADLYALLVALHVQRASFVGLSLGGRIAIDFALTHPEMVDRLVLASPGLSGWRWTAQDTTWQPEARAALAHGDTSAAVLTWLKSDYMRPAMEHASLVTRLCELTAANTSYWKGLLRHGDTERALSPAAATRLRLIVAPTLLVVGDRDNLDIQRIVDTLLQDLPHARKVTIAGAGHMVNMEQPETFTKLVREFLRPH